MSKAGKDTLLRVLDMIKLIPYGKKGQSTQDIMNLLQSKGYKVDIRTIQRDLNKYSTLFGLINTREQYTTYWFRSADTAFNWISQISSEEALSITLVNRFLRDYLPNSIVNSLNPIFYEAENKLKESQSYMAWNSKIASIPDGFSPKLHTVPKEVVSTVHMALLENKVLQITYGNSQKQLLVEPLGLILRHNKQVLVVRYLRETYKKTLLIHRIKTAKCTKNTFKPYFNLQSYINSDEAFILQSDEPIDLELEATGYAKKLLCESSILPNQEIKVLNNEWLNLKVTIGHTVELENWLMSLMDHIKIISPPEFREKMQSRIRKSLALNS